MISVFLKIITWVSSFIEHHDQFLILLLKLNVHQIISLIGPLHLQKDKKKLELTIIHSQQVSEKFPHKGDLLFIMWGKLISKKGWTVVLNPKSLFPRWVCSSKIHKKIYKAECNCILKIERLNVKGIFFLICMNVTLISVNVNLHRIQKL